MTLNKRKKKKAKVSYYTKPEDMSIEDWQRALRRQFAEKQNFDIVNIGDEDFFSDYEVHNPLYDSYHKVAFRDDRYSRSFCSCADFKINQLGTCKHLESVRMVVEKKRGYKTAVRNGKEPHYSSIYIDYLGALKIKLKIGMENREEIRHNAKKFFTHDLIIKKEVIQGINKFISLGKKRGWDLRVYPDALDYIIDLRSYSKRIELIDSVIPTKGQMKILDKLLKTQLYPYQREGVYFAIKRGRCIIADDMGLGKTIQALCMAEFYFKYLKIKKVLIICPTSLKIQWLNEIKKFTESKVHVIEGMIHKRKQQYLHEVNYSITSHGMARNDLDWINDSDYDLIILDEAQRIKNWDTKTSRAFKRLESTYALALSGTPVENKLQELYSVMQFVDIYKLGPLHQFIANHTIRDENGKLLGYQKLDKIGKLVSDRLIRRKKNEVLEDLPERIDMNRFVPMSQGQVEYYEEYRVTVARLVNKWKATGFLNENDRRKLMINLSCMRMVCDSTFIVDQKNRHDTKVDELMTIVREIIVASDEKIIVFSEWKRMHQLIAAELDACGLRYEYLHGSLSSKKRAEIITKFKTDVETRIFLSTDAGGQGLNLQEASVIINVDLPWNPAVLEQRIGRVHRIGQKRNIRVINLVSQGSIESNMLDRLRFKSGMASGILDGGEADIFVDAKKFANLVKDISDNLQQGRNVIGSIADDDINANDEKPDKDSSEIANVESLVIENESFGESNQMGQTHGKNNGLSKHPGEKLNEVMDQGMKFLSGMLEVMTGGTSSFKDQQIEIDKNTGEVTMRFKIKGLDKHIDSASHNLEK